MLSRPVLGRWNGGVFERTDPPVLVLGSPSTHGLRHVDPPPVERNEPVLTCRVGPPALFGDLLGPLALAGLRSRAEPWAPRWPEGFFAADS